MVPITIDLRGKCFLVVFVLGSHCRTGWRGSEYFKIVKTSDSSESDHVGAKPIIGTCRECKHKRQPRLDKKTREFDVDVIEILRRFFYKATNRSKVSPKYNSHISSKVRYYTIKERIQVVEKTSRSIKIETKVRMCAYFSVRRKIQTIFFSFYIY